MRIYSNWESCYRNMVTKRKNGEVTEKAKRIKIKSYILFAHCLLTNCDIVVYLKMRKQIIFSASLR